MVNAEQLRDLVSDMLNTSIDFHPSVKDKRDTIFDKVYNKVGPLRPTLKSLNSSLSTCAL